MNNLNPRVDFYFNQASGWKDELIEMRAIVLGCQLTEDLKWGCPCYTFEGKNIVLLHTFKEYCAFLFFKGALMKDPKRILIRQTENVQAARQVRFTGVKEITKLSATLRAYIYEAVAVEEAGLKMVLKKTKEYTVPEELQQKFKELPGFETAFAALSPGRQRAYLLHFAAAKQAKTRESRIEKNIQQILDGKGLNEA